MEIEIKKAIRAVNSSAVILPRAWLSKEVRVELVKKTPEKMLLEVLNIAKKYLDLKTIIGIYLAGSYARNEENEESDIDVLIITNDVDREIIKEGMYNILIISEELLKQKLENDLFPIGQMIREGRALINEKYLGNLRIKVTKKNIEWYIKTTKEKLELIKRILNKAGKRIDNKVVYTLILRIRTLYIIQNMIKNKDYSNKEFIRLIANLSGTKNAYDSYLAIKNETKKPNITAKEEAEKLAVYLEKQLSDLQKRF